MNFVAHAHVALRRAGTSWDVAFGAVLPDLASMAGTRIDRSLLSPPVEEGVALHHRTDTVLQPHEYFTPAPDRYATLCSTLACMPGRLERLVTLVTSFSSTAAF
jgi:hypothetical protein